MSSRRKFIQKLTAPVLALPLLNLTQTKFLSDSEEKPYDGPILRVAILGLGSYGTRVADAMQACSRAKLS